MLEKNYVTPMLGADPEIFLKRNRRPIPAFGLIGGTKKEPLEMEGAPFKGFMYQEDGAAMEFNIPPAETGSDFVNYMAIAGGWIKKFLSARELVASSVNHMKLAPSLLKQPEALNIGCVADMCAYLPKGERTRDPITADMLGEHRYAGGHIHVQFNHDMVPKHVFVKLADLAVMLPGVVVDKQGGRRRFYGRAGIYRDKEYGVELRGPSNMWALKLTGLVASINATNDDVARRMYANHIIAKLFQLAYWTNDPVQVDALGDLYTRIPWHDVQRAINDEDKNLAVEIMQMIRMQKKAGYNQVFYLVDANGRVI